VLVAFAGGVRTRETFGAAGNVPTLEAHGQGRRALQAREVVEPGAFRRGALDLHGRLARRVASARTRAAEDPTLFEYLRRDLALPASQVWISTSGGAQQTNYSYGLHPDYGARFGANTVDGDGLFNAEFKSILDAWGKPKALSNKEQELLAKLRAAIESRGAAASLNSPESAAQVEKYILEELTSGTADIRGANAADAKTLRVAAQLASVVFKPKVLARRAAAGRRRARLVQRLRRGHPPERRRTRASCGTSCKGRRRRCATRRRLFVVPEFGREQADLNSNGTGWTTATVRTISSTSPRPAGGPTSRAAGSSRTTCRSSTCVRRCVSSSGARAAKSRAKRLPRLLA
jgi:hypothetical protein